jgi:hypothetical protein
MYYAWGEEECIYSYDFDKETIRKDTTRKDYHLSRQRRYRWEDNIKRVFLRNGMG